MDPELWLEDLLLLSHLVDPYPPYPAISEGSDDDHYFAAAAAGQATLVVSGDPGPLRTITAEREEGKVPWAV